MWHQMMGATVYAERQSNSQNNQTKRKKGKKIKSKRTNKRVREQEPGQRDELTARTNQPNCAMSGLARAGNFLRNEWEKGTSLFRTGKAIHAGGKKEAEEERAILHFCDFLYRFSSCPRCLFCQEWSLCLSVGSCNPQEDVTLLWLHTRYLREDFWYFYDIKNENKSCLDNSSYFAERGRALFDRNQPNYSENVVATWGVFFFFWSQLVQSRLQPCPEFDLQYLSV